MYAIKATQIESVESSQHVCAYVCYWCQMVFDMINVDLSAYRLTAYRLNGKSYNKKKALYSEQ